MTRIFKNGWRHKRGSSRRRLPKSKRWRERRYAHTHTHTCTHAHARTYMRGEGPGMEGGMDRLQTKRANTTSRDRVGASRFTQTSTTHFKHAGVHTHTHTMAELVPCCLSAPNSTPQPFISKHNIRCDDKTMQNEYQTRVCCS